MLSTGVWNAITFLHVTVSVEQLSLFWELNTQKEKCMDASVNCVHCSSTVPQPCILSSIPGFFECLSFSSSDWSRDFGCFCGSLLCVVEKLCWQALKSMVKTFQGVTGTQCYRLGEARDLINVALLRVSQVVLCHSSQVAACLVCVQINLSY